MDQDCSLFDGNIEELVKTSKQLQGKMQQELRRQSISSSYVASVGEREELPPIWDNILLNPYVKNVVSDYLVDGSNLINESAEVELKARHRRSIEELNKQKEMREKNFPEKTQELKKLVTVGTQVMQNQVQVQKLVPDKVKPTSFPPSKKVQKQTLKSNSKSGVVSKKESKLHYNAYKPAVKQSVSTQRLPLQRFADTCKGTIDFSSEHPHLELDLSGHQDTLFPRRFYKATKTNASAMASPDNDSVNLSTAKIRTPDTAVVIQETWKEVLLKNRSVQTETKAVQSKKSVEVVEGSSKVIPKAEIKKSDCVDIISSSANALFYLEKQNRQLSQQNKCNLQRFPVIYIRPECQVQRVANISIRGDSETNLAAADNFSSNVKYVECIHEQHLQVENSPLRIERTISNEEPNCALPKEKNKYFKALEVADHLNKFSASSTQKLKSKRRSRTSSLSSLTQSRSTSKVQDSESSPATETSDNDVHNVIKEMFSSSKRTQHALKKNFISPLPTRREVYVQTDKKNTAVTSPSPPPSPPPPAAAELTSSILTDHHSIPVCSPTTKPEDVEDDFITKIFERIRNDTPNALQAFKDRNTTTHEAMPCESPTIKQHQVQQKKHHHQTLAISNASNIELHPNEIEPELASVRPNSNHSILQMTPPVDSPVTIQPPPPPPAGDECRKFLLVQQNPLFVQTINRIKSSAVHDAMPSDDRIKEDRHKYPTDAEIKRAVKIFLDSLTLESSGGERKSIKEGGDAGRKLTLPTFFKGSGISTKYISSVSSNISNSSNSSSSSISNGSNVRRVRSNILRCDMSRSSTSTSISLSDSEPESDVTVDNYCQPSAELAINSLSEGEVLSMGEI